MRRAVLSEGQEDRLPRGLLEPALDAMDKASASAPRCQQRGKEQIYKNGATEIGQCCGESSEGHPRERWDARGSPGLSDSGLWPHTGRSRRRQDCSEQFLGGTRRGIATFCSLAWKRASARSVVTGVLESSVAKYPCPPAGPGPAGEINTETVLVVKLVQVTGGGDQEGEGTAPAGSGGPG